ncbi:MAG: ABC transporter ATP-binding protein [Chlorobi bacterium]|nr:ABC transporter ATP-binding protein [Chlorobiota bacterium]
MSDIAIKLENISKQYRLGVVGTGTLSHDLNRWFARIRGKEDPTLKIGQSNQLAEAGGDYVWALKDINLEVKKGEILGIIGKNGAGKSTLLKLLSRVTGPTTGQIKVNGRIASLLEVGTGFHPELTGRENIFLNGAILGMRKSEIRKKLDEIVDFAGVAKYLDTPVKRYSSGMYVRLAFAVAAHLEPDILVVDEVLAVGDAEFQKKAIGKMQDVSKDGGRTVLFVSHNMASVQLLCSRGVYLENGMISYVNRTDKVIDKYLNSSSKTVEKELSLFNRDIKINNITFLNKYGKKVTTLLSGQKITIRISYTANTYLKKVIIRLIFFNSNREFLFICNNYHTNEPFDNLENSGSLECDIDKLPLNSGSYHIDIRINSDSKMIFDKEQAISFDVISGDFYGTGKLPAIKRGVLVEHRWKIQQNG